MSITGAVEEMEKLGLTAMADSAASNITSNVARGDIRFRYMGPKKPGTSVPKNLNFTLVGQGAPAVKASDQLAAASKEANTETEAAKSIKFRRSGNARTPWQKGARGGRKPPVPEGDDWANQVEDMRDAQFAQDPSWANQVEDVREARADAEIREHIRSKNTPPSAEPEINFTMPDDEVASRTSYNRADMAIDKRTAKDAKSAKEWADIMRANPIRKAAMDAENNPESLRKLADNFGIKHKNMSNDEVSNAIFNYAKERGSNPTLWDRALYHKVPQYGVAGGTTWFLVNQLASNKGQMSNQQLYNQQ